MTGYRAPRSEDEATLAARGVNETIRYEPDEACPPLIAIGAGLQGTLLGLPSMMLIVAITVRAVGQDESYLRWAVFAALIIAGISTILQAARLGRVGSGHVLLMAMTASFIPISVLALDAGGPATLASLIVVAALFFLVVTAWLPLLRRMITPVVSGTVLMLIAATVLPIALNRVQEVPEGASMAAGPAVAAVTLGASVLLALRASGSWRLWTPILGIGIGCGVAALFQLYEFQALADASWAGVPRQAFLELDVTPGGEFWALLPAFVVVTVVVGIKGIGSSVAVQQASRRRPRATDFRLVQGALTTNGLGILLCGLAGTPPTTMASGRSISLITFTGVAARSVGYVVGSAFVVLAFFPKVTATLTTIPSPVMGGFLLTMMGTLFVEGIRTVVQDGLDSRKALIIGVSFATGLGLENQTIFTDLVGGTWGALLDNGLLMGALVAIALSLFVELTSPRRKRVEVKLDPSALPAIDEFLSKVASGANWNDASRDRLRAAGEEALASLAGLRDGDGDGEAPRLLVEARPGDRAVELEFLAAFDEENLEDRLAYLDEEAETEDDGDLSLRLLRHYASSVRHQKYHGLDVVTVVVDQTR